MSFKVVIGESMSKAGIKLFEEHPDFNVVMLEKNESERLKQEIADADVLIVRSGVKVTPELLGHAKQLKIVGRAGAGIDNIHTETCTAKKIVVMRVQGGNSNAVVELTLGLMLDWCRHIAKANASMAAGKWEKKLFKGVELKGKTVGIVGLGRIGAGVAKRCQAFEMKTIGYDAYLPKERAEEIGVALYDKLDDVLVESDFITLHVPITKETRDLISTEQFKIMKPTSVVVNIARGGIVNETALFTALTEKTIGGACVDVYSKEPAKKDEFPFIGLDNVIATPHLGASTAEAQIVVSEMICTNIIKALTENVYNDAVNLDQVK